MVLPRQNFETLRLPLPMSIPTPSNPSFSPTTSHPGFKTWVHQWLLHFTQLFNSIIGNASPVSQILVHFELPKHHFLIIHQAVQSCHKSMPKQTSALSQLHSGHPTGTAKVQDLRHLKTFQCMPLQTSTGNSTCSFFTNEFWHEQFKIMHCT